MPRFVIEIVTDPGRAVPGARRVRGELRRVETAAQRVERALKRAFIGISAGLLIRETARLADEFTNLQNRLKLVTDSEEDLIEVTQELFEIADRTRTSFQSVATIYSRTALSAKDLGVAQEELLQFTESVNQAIIISGVSAQEARAGLIQFSQGIASGALRGDELRSVLEQLPAIADVLAKALGVTRGELRKLGETGGITSEIILKSFELARGELEEQFSETVPTLGQSWERLRNTFIEIIADVNETTGATSQLTDAINGLITALSSTGGTVAIVKTAQTINVAVQGIALAFKLAGTSAALFFGIVEEIAAIVPAVFQRLASEVGIFAVELQAAIFDLLGEDAQANAARQGAAIARGFLEPLESDLFESATRINDRVNTFFDQLVEDATPTANAFADLFGLERVGGPTEQQLQMAAAAVAQFSALTALGFRASGEAVDDYTGALAHMVDGLSTAERASAKLEERQLQQIRVLERQLELVPSQVNNAQRLAEFEIAYQAAIDAGNEELAERLRRIQELTVVVEEAEAAQKALNEEQGRFTEEQGFAAGLEQIQSTIENTGTQVEATLVNAFGAAEDALVEFVLTGEANFSRLVDSILADLTRLLFRQALFALLGGGGPPGGGLGGNSLGSQQFAGLAGLQRGGPVERDRTVLVGEEGPELFTPQNAGTITPAGETAAIMRGAGDIAPTTVNVSPPEVTIRNVIEGEDDAEREQEILNVIRRNRRAVRGTIG